MPRDGKAYKQFIINCFYRNETDPLMKLQILEEAERRLNPEELGRVEFALTELIEEGIVKRVDGRRLYELTG